MNGKYLKQGGSSFIAKKRGHTPNLDDLKTATPSVFSFNEMLSGYDKKPPGLKWALYCSPS